MLLAVMKAEGHIPGGGYHYMLHPIALNNVEESKIFKLMGYIILEVPDEKGKRLIIEANNAIIHQVEVARLTEHQLHMNDRSF